MYIAAKSPFNRSDTEELYANAPSVIERYFPGVKSLFKSRNWSLPSCIGRVYDISKAERELNFHPYYNFGNFLNEVIYQTKGVICE